MHIEKKVEEVLYLKNEIFASATNSTDYSLQEAADLVREQWLEYVDRASKIEDDIIKNLPILNSVQVDVNRTISRIAEAEFTPMWSDRWPRWESHWANHLDSLRATLESYRDDPDEFEGSVRMDSFGRLASDPEEAEAIRIKDLGKVREHIRRLLERAATLGFPIIYAWMKHLRSTCEHWDELAKIWEDDAGLDLCQDVLATFQRDLDTSLSKAEPELADVIAAVRRKRDKMHKNVSNEWANEFKRKFDNAIPTWHREPIKWHVVDPKGAIGYVFKSENSPMMPVFYELMGGFDSKTARAIRLCWMKILIENSTIGDEWDEEKIREVRNQFSEADFKAQFGEDIGTSFLEMLIDAETIASHPDMSNEMGWKAKVWMAIDELIGAGHPDMLKDIGLKARMWLAIDELMVMNRSHRLTKEIVQFYAASYVKGRITKEDFFNQARRILKKSKFISDPNFAFWDGYIEEWTGFAPD